MPPDETDITYTVEAAQRVYDAALEQYRYIAVEKEQPLNAAKWFEAFEEAVTELAFLPRRYPVIPEAEIMDIELRRVLVHSHRLIFTIDDATHTVKIVELRHGARLLRRRDLQSLLDEDAA
ncbi:MAG: type II toxin-antitoxin system RelE/ParE family toxin [Planctomycetota bacterium]